MHPTGARAETEAGTKEGRRRTAPRQSAPIKLLAAWAAPGRGRHKTQAQLSLCACVEDPKTGTAGNTGPAPYRAARSLSSVDGESAHPWAGANPVWPNTVSAPHTQRYPSAAPRPPRSATEQADLNERPPPPARVRAEIRHWRDGKQRPNKQREPLQKGPVQQIKIPVGDTDYTGRGL